MKKNILIFLFSFFCSLLQAQQSELEIAQTKFLKGYAGSLVGKELNSLDMYSPDIIDNWLRLTKLYNKYICTYFAKDTIKYNVKYENGYLNELEFLPKGSFPFRAKDQKGDGIEMYFSYQNLSSCIHISAVDFKQGNAIAEYKVVVCLDNDGFLLSSYNITSMMLKDKVAHGDYREYFIDGKPKVKGQYQINKDETKMVESVTYNPETYGEERAKHWLSEKIGVWNIYNYAGKLVRKETYVNY